MFRILIADYDLVVLGWYQAVLAREGHQVVAHATTVDDLLDRSRRLDPELIVTETRLAHGMPADLQADGPLTLDHSGGLDAITELSRIKRVPTVVITAWANDEFVRRSAALPVMAYLMKPITADELRVSVVIASSRFRER